MRWALALILLAGCSNINDQPAVIGEPLVLTCADLIGMPTTAELLEEPCKLPDGTLFFGGSSSCSNGITMLWNDIGWGYLNEPLQEAETWPGGCSGE